ncbi:hypothetical protein C7N43_03995 [Sphingobacteriales bacterium UPWRP_1]|nr:hypothetical protein B6N25_05635 [Sphingobacteriales bacterium TSM_CSS]PSJ78369.1 hypothetical protein C7N43_03995 [Sphingobacteriales bacterium UPWRP_1]
MATFCKFIVLLSSVFFMNWAANAGNPLRSFFDNIPSKTEKNSTIGISPIADVSDIKEFGLLKNVEDSGYPFVTLTIEFPERGFTEYFSLNLEEVKNVNAPTLSNLVGRYLSFEYNSEIVNALLDLRMNGVSLLNEGVVTDFDSDTKTIMGILSNAAEETTGDLAGELYIKTEEEITEKFPFFITPEIVRANGKIVVGYYQQRTLNTITSIEVN